VPFYIFSGKNGKYKLGTTPVNVKLLLPLRQRWGFRFQNRKILKTVSIPFSQCHERQMNGNLALSHPFRY
jgi:hypothetical protein